MAFFTGKEAGIEKTSTLSPEQQEIMKKLSGFTTGKIGQGLPGFEGPLTAPLSGVEQAGISRLGEYVGGGLPDVTQQGIGAFQDILAGADPKKSFEFFQQFIAPEEQRMLKEELIPTFKESQVPGGVLRGTGTEGGIADIISRFGTSQMGRIGADIQSRREQALRGLGMLPEVSGLAGGVPQIQAAMQYGGLPRLIEQQDINARFAEFIRTTPELSPILQQAQDILKIQTQAAFMRPAEKSGIAQIGEALAPIVGQAAGGYFGGLGMGKALAAAPKTA